LSSDQIPTQLLRRYHLGASVEELAAETGIPQDRIRVRLRAAAMCFLSLGADRNFPVQLHKLAPFDLDWELLWFD
jgi:hypothetical protein